MTIIISGVGRIGKDAITRHTQGGDAVTGFSLAMDDGFGDKKVTLWFDVSGWGKRYTAVAEYLVKGSQVFVSGELGEREHEGKTYKTIRLTALDLVGGKKEGEKSAPKREGRAGGGGTNPPASDDPFPDEIPFVTMFGTF